jgi:hypothetical protein
MNIFIGILFIGIGIYSIFYAYSWFEKVKFLKAKGIIIKAEIVAIENDGDGSFDVYFEFHTSNGFKVKDKIESVGENDYRIGQKIEILMDENDSQIIF